MNNKGSANIFFVLFIAILVAFAVYMLMFSPLVTAGQELNKSLDTECELAADLYNFDFWKVDVATCYLSDDNSNWKSLQDIAH